MTRVELNRFAVGKNEFTLGSDALSLSQLTFRDYYRAPAPPRANA
jgi:hypothetical protein